MDDLRFQKLLKSVHAAFACCKADRFEEAARIFSDILPRIRSVKLPGAWWVYGDALARLGRLEAAADALTTAVGLDPNYWLAWKSLGGVYATLGQPERARDALVRATQLHRDDPELWSNLGVIERRLGRSESAIACYQLAIATNPNYPLAWRNLGNAWRDAKAWDDAIACYERLVELRPRNARDWSDLGIAYARINRRVDAQRALERAVAVDPGNVDATYNLALWHLEEGDPRGARKWYGRLRTLSVASAREMAELVARGAGISIDAAEGVLSATTSAAG